MRVNAVLVPVALVLSLLAFSHAQALEVTPPPDRFVAPGETVTLAFDIKADDDVEVQLDASSRNGWFLVAPPRDLDLEADVPALVEVTVEVPRDASAFTVDRITLRIDGVEPPVERVVELSVIDVVDATLQAPTEAAIDAGLDATVINLGNSPERGALELLFDGELIERQFFLLSPFERRTLRFELRDEGPHTLVLTTERGVEVTRTVRVFRFGAPAPEPFLLTTQLSGGIDLEGDWDGRLSARGALSDFSAVDVRIDAPDWRTSYAEVRVDQGTVRIGAAGAAPFRLDLPRDLGLTVAYQLDDVGVAGAVATVNDRLAGYAAASWTLPDLTVAAGVGGREGAPLAALRATYAGTDYGLAFSGRYRDESITADLSSDIRAADTTSTLRLQARDLLRPRARLDFSVRHRAGPSTIYGEVTAPIGESASWSGRAGITQGLAPDLPGDWQLDVEAGSRASFARLTHRIPLGAEWRTSNALGVRYDTEGFGLTYDTTWAWRGAGSFSLDSRLTYYPEPGDLDGSIRSRFQIAVDAVSLAVGGTWNLTNETLNLTATLDWGEGPLDIGLDASARYRYGTDPPQWSAELGLSATVTFDIAIPEDAVDAAGGRRLGTLEGSVLADGLALSGVILEVGPFRVQTDARGRFSIDLPPGTYDVRVDTATLPSGYRLVDRPDTTVEVTVRTTTDVTFRATREAVISQRRPPLAAGGLTQM